MISDQAHKFILQECLLIKGTAELTIPTIQSSLSKILLFRSCRTAYAYIKTKYSDNNQVIYLLINRIIILGSLCFIISV